MKKLYLLAACLLFSLTGLRADDVYLRASQIGYKPDDAKIAVAFGKTALPGTFTVANADDGKQVFEGKATAVEGVAWGKFDHHADLDFSKLKTPGKYVIKAGGASPSLR